MSLSSSAIRRTPARHSRQFSKPVLPRVLSTISSSPMRSTTLGRPVDRPAWSRESVSGSDYRQHLKGIWIPREQQPCFPTSAGWFLSTRWLKLCAKGAFHNIDTFLCRSLLKRMRQRNTRGLPSNSPAFFSRTVRIRKCHREQCIFSSGGLGS